MGCSVITRSSACVHDDDRENRPPPPPQHCCSQPLPALLSSEPDTARDGRRAMRSKLTTIILIGMVLGILVGYACHILWPDPKIAKSIADYISLLTDIFLRLIKMIIAPLVFSTLVVGVAHMGDTKAVGR